MFVERRINPSTGVVELWQCEWENYGGMRAKKAFLGKIGVEQPVVDEVDTFVSEAAAICWSYGRTLGNIAVLSPAMAGTFSAKAGDDALLPCDFVHAGKYRNGAERWWCRTHQTHWGTKADIASRQKLDCLVCANHTQRMNYVVSPLSIDLDEHAEVGIWCSMPAAISTVTIPRRAPKIHVHVRKSADDRAKAIDKDFDAISIRYRSELRLFENTDISRVNITPPSAFEFVNAVETDRKLDCINCSHCGYPHLDLGDFGRTPHRKHFCANCGRDSTWSSTPIISTPLKPLHDTFARNTKYNTPDRFLNLDDFGGDCSYTVWASTPAIVWTAARPQEFGIHVHVHRGQERIVDDTFGEVVLDGSLLDRAELIQAMVTRCIV